jgi:hypothetical protein
MSNLIFVWKSVVAAKRLLLLFSRYKIFRIIGFFEKGKKLIFYYSTNAYFLDLELQFFEWKEFIFLPQRILSLFFSSEILFPNSIHEGLSIFQQSSLKLQSFLDPISRG